MENLFARNSGPCPQCGKILWKKGFWRQIFDDPMIEKENYIRKKLRKVIFSFFSLCRVIILYDWFHGKIKIYAELIIFIFCKLLV